MYCKYCGKSIDKDSVFCNYCGKQQITDGIKELDNNTVNRNVKIQNKTFWKKFAYIVISIIGIIIIFGAILLFYNNKKIADVSIDKVSKELAESIKKYDRIYDFHEGLARVEKGKKFGFIDKLGNEIIPCKYDDADDFKFGVAVVEIDDKNGLINKQGNTILVCKYDNIHTFDKDSTATAYLNKKAGRINITGDVVIPFEYEECCNFSEGLSAVRKNGLYGFIDKSNRLIIPCQYEELYDGIGFNEGLVGVKNGVGSYGEWGYIDKTGKIVIPFQRGLTGKPFSSGLTTIYRGGFDYNNWTHTPFEIAFINKSGELVCEYIEVRDIQGFRDGYSVIKNKTGWVGLINISGDFVIPCKYSFIANGFDDKYVLIDINGKQGMANKSTGQIVIPIVYEIGYSGWMFHEGVIPVKKDGKFGYINECNQIVIPFIYDYATSFSEGFAVVQRYGKYGYLDRYGNDTFN